MFPYANELPTFIRAIREEIYSRANKEYLTSTICKNVKGGVEGEMPIKCVVVERVEEADYHDNNS